MDKRLSEVTYVYNGDYMNWVDEPREPCLDAMPYTKEKAISFETCIADKNKLCPWAEKGVKR